MNRPNDPFPPSIERAPAVERETDKPLVVSGEKPCPRWVTSEGRKEGTSRAEIIPFETPIHPSIHPSFSLNFAERNIFFFFFTIDFIHLRISCIVQATSNVESERDSSRDQENYIRTNVSICPTIEILKIQYPTHFSKRVFQRERIDSTPILNLGLTRGSTSARFDVARHETGTRARATKWPSLFWPFDQPMGVCPACLKSVQPRLVRIQMHETLPRLINRLF